MVYVQTRSQWHTFFLFNLNMGCLVFPVTEEVVQYLEIIKDTVVKDKVVE